MDKEPVYIRTDFKNIYAELTRDQIERLDKFVKELEEEPDAMERD